MKDILLKFIEHAGNKSEVELFWKLFHDLPPMKFAVISIAYEVLREDLESLADSLALMHKLEIFPIIVLRLQKEDYFEYKVAQKRAPKGFDDVALKKNFTLFSGRLMKELRKRKARVRVVEGVFEWNDKNRMKIVTTRIAAALSHFRIPIIAPIGFKNGKKVVLDSDVLSRALVKVIKPKKFILINREGGVLDTQNQVVPFLNVSHKTEWGFEVRKDMKPVVRDIRQFLKSTVDCALVITSAESVLKEIFTVKGMGTFIKCHTLYLATYYEDVYTRRIKHLLEEAFEKILVKDYFDTDPLRIIYEKNYEGIAIMQEINEIPYLDKFAVAKACEGTGLGKSLWLKVCQRFPQMIWRATPENSMNSFYLRECDGCIKFPEWHVYWRNLEEKDILPSVHAVLMKPRTLVKEVLEEE